MTNETTDNGARRQQILEGALRVFSSKGFHKATNKDIAEAAGGISPGLIYWYFKDKQDLFLSLLRERAPIFEVAAHPEQLMALAPEQGLALVAQSFLSAFRVPSNVAMMRLVVSEASRFPQVGESLFRAGPGRVLSLISAYLQHHIDAGVLRPHDPTVAARSFIGMLIGNVVARELLGEPETQAPSDETIAATVVAVFLQGLSA